MELLRLKELMKEKHITGKALSEKVDVNHNTISRISNGASFPSGELLLKLANELNVDIRELFYPTKDIGESPELNGFIEYQNETYRIKSPEDLSHLLQKINKKN